MLRAGGQSDNRESTVGQSHCKNQRLGTIKYTQKFKADIQQRGYFGHANGTGSEICYTGSSL